jgi:hypothetical protein
MKVGRWWCRAGNPYPLVGTGPSTTHKTGGCADIGFLGIAETGEDNRAPAPSRRSMKKALDWIFCNVIGGHPWRQLPDHPMHHKCDLCGRECWDWVW